MLLNIPPAPMHTRPHIVRVDGVWKCSALRLGIVACSWASDPSVALRNWLHYYHSENFYVT